MRVHVVGTGPVGLLLTALLQSLKHNKDLFESLDDPLALLERLHIR